jgi:hypothetical protein
VKDTKTAVHGLRSSKATATGAQSTN